MTRLTNELRQEISKATMAAQFAKRHAELDKRSDRLANAVHNHVYSASELAKVADLPQTWIKCGKAFRVNAGGYVVKLQSKTNLPVMRDYDPNGYNQFTSLTTDTKLCQDIQAFANDVKTLEEDEEKARFALWQVLAASNTFEQLFETWPAGAKFYKPLEPKNDKIMLPAIKVAEVNAMLGL